MLLLLVCAIVCGCTTKSVDNSYSIGAILPMKGECSEASQEIVRGMEIAKDEINARGGVAGIPLNLVVRDSRATDMSLLESFDNMRRNGVKVFTLGFGKETIFTKKLVASCNDVFVNYMCSYPPITLDMPNCTRIFVNGSQVGDIMSKAVKRENEQILQIVAMNVDNYFGKADGDYLAFNLKVDKTKYYRDVFGEGERRFDIFGEQILRLNADYVFCIGFGSELHNFTKSLSESGYKGTVIANCGLAAYDFPVPENISLYKVETLFEQGKIDNPVYRKFVAAYEAKFGKRPSWKAAYGYDSIMLLTASVEKSRFIPSKMRGYFTKLKYEGAIGKIEFDSSADSLSEMSLVKK